MQEKKSRTHSKIEGYGVKGLQSKPWRKTFATTEALLKWAEKNDAEIHGTRTAE